MKNLNYAFKKNERNNKGLLIFILNKRILYGEKYGRRCKRNKIIPSDLFDSNNHFDMIMLSILTARDDLNNINMLLDENKEDAYMSVFIFKLSLGITKMRICLHMKYFKNEFYKNKLNHLNNWKKVEEKYNKLVECNSGNGTDSFSYKVLNKIRNQAFHYPYKKRDLDNISKIVEQLKDEELIIKISSEVCPLFY